MTVYYELAGKHTYDYHCISQLKKLLGFRLKMRIIITIRARNAPNTSFCGVDTEENIPA